MSKTEQTNRRNVGAQLAGIARAALFIFALAWPAQEALAQACPAGAAVDIDVIDSQSYCELCGVGQVTLRVNYDGSTLTDPDITNIVISADLDAPDLVPVPGTTTVDVDSGPEPPPPTPTLVGGQWTWNFGGFDLEPGLNQFLEITFQVRRANGVSEEGLQAASKAITASVDYETATNVCPSENDFHTLDFRAPNPSITKAGRNVDAGQTGYSDPMHGHNNDDVIWRIQIENPGQAALQDVRFDDLMAAGNLNITYACPSESDALAIANNNGVGPLGDCIAASNSINDFIVGGDFGSQATTNFVNGGAANGFTRNLNGRDIDVNAGATTAVVYVVGKVTANASCVSGGRVNTVSGFEFGCEADANGAGGLTGTDTGSTATLRTYHGDGQAQLSITRSFTGVNTVGTTTVSTQPLGARGLITLTINNQTGGTIKNIYLDEVLPEDYVVDPTYWTGGFTKNLPTLGTPVAGQSSVDPAFGNAYPGMIDRLTWEDPTAGSWTPPSQIPMQNTSMRLRLWSSTTHPNYADQEHLLRHGDIVTVSIPIVLVTENRATFEPYDRQADLDITPEVATDDTDPERPAAQNNGLTAEYDTFCASQGNDGAGHFQFAYNNANINPNPEDLDVQITDITNNPSSVFILTNDRTQELPIRVRLTNNGGHSATNYQAFVSFGATMEVSNAPAGCSAVALAGSPSQPDPWKTWTLPSAIPSTATVYRCTQPASIAPGQTVNLDFRVIKEDDAARVALDDLSLRADVVGEISLYGSAAPYNGSSLLWFPTPVANGDGQLARANNYTLDGVRQRVIGFNLIKTTLACNENEPSQFEPGPNIKQARRVEIGEECSYRVRTGGWFGFETPGFQLIEVENVAVTDNLPTGQGYVSSTDPAPTSSAQIQGIQLMNQPVPPTPNGLIAPGVPFTWNFNQSSPIDRLDEWFQADTTTRVLNNPVNVVAAPNQHALNSTNVLTSTFTAIFTSEGVETPYALGPSTVGYPNEPIRREDLKITEPRITLVKEVCNETRYGVGPACTNWTTLANDGDAYNNYIYRLVVTNEAAAGGIARSPAYDLVVTDTLDASGLACVLPFDTDGLDNDIDTQTDAGDANGEGSIANNCTSPATPVSAVITFSHTHSTGLRRLNPGQSTTLYYRVDFDDDAAPQQVFTNSYVVSYDSLAGSTDQNGNQTIDPRDNGNIGGARVYTSAPAIARVQMIPVETRPKAITRTSNTPAPTPPATQDVVVGEEVEFELTTLLPVALLRNFVIRDELPPGLRCAEAPAINLSAPPYSAAGFQPGGTFTPTCTDNLVEWNFGNQRITQGTTPDNRYPFSIRFITRVENSALTSNGVVISNGSPATNVYARYRNEADSEVTYTFGQVSMTVREPVIALTKSFAPVVNADAADELTVTVTATNNGTSPAYNLRVFDDLTSGVFTYVGNVGGANPPTADTALLGADRPVFSYPAGYAIAPGASVSFTFVVRVAGTPQPHRVLANTIYATWTSLPGRSTALNSSGQIGVDGSATGMRNGALPHAGDAINDYETQASASVTVPGLALNKVDLDAVLPPRIGVHKPFRITVTLPEGETQNLIVADNLNFGAVSYVLANNASFDVTYEFIGIDSINGQAPGEAAFTAIPADGATGVATWNIGRVVTTSENDRAVNAITPAIRINYFARINNDLVTDAGDVLRNSVDTTYRNGESGATQTLTYTADPITVIEPVLTATKELTNVTPGKQPTDPLALNDIVQYVVTIVNSGMSTAFDVNIVDTLPLELTLDTNYAPNATINATPVAGFVAAPAGAPDGPLVWGRANNDGSLDLPPGAFIELRYQVIVRAPADPGVGVENRVYTDWTSLNDVNTHERTGAGCPAITAPNDYCFGPAIAMGTGVPAPPPAALTKANTQPTAAVGEVFRYRITVPSVAYPYALYDVRITDDLAASAADMRFIGATKISGSTTWTPVNTGAGTSVVIEDTTNGIDIPANEQIVLEIAVQLTDTANNVTGLTFTNTANYYFNRIDNNVASQRPGQAGTTQPMTIVNPDTLTMDKTGPTQMALGQPGAFALDVRNTGTGRAWDVSIYDRIPNTPTSGMCEQPPANFTAQLYQADGTTTVGAALVAGTDFSTTFAPAPDCLLTIRMLTPAAAIPPDHRLIVRYNAYLDNDSERNATLTNIAGATEWFSADRSNPTYADEVRTFTYALTDGTPNVVDHQDAHTVTVNLPVLRFEKTVSNVSSGQNPATHATPGDTLRYRILIENLVNDPVPNFSLRDELGRLNNAAVYASGTLNLVTTPAGADVSNTNASGGVNNAGVVDIRNLSLGGLNSTIVIEYDVRLVPVLPNNSYVQNQAQVYVSGVEVGRSDDPTVNAAPDPLVLGDEDPTRVQITSAPRFRVLKTSTYLGASAQVLRAGERMRYTITVKNIGTDNATGVSIRDQIPANTTYVAGSTTINGTQLTDNAQGLSPLVDGIPVYAPEDTTAGVMRADATNTTTNVATLTFEVTVYPDLLDGTVISNQAFVSAVDFGIVDYPSDDPRTPVLNDPTRDVVGNAPLLFATKQAVLQVDQMSPGIVDPGDTLRYTITIYNNGAIPATNVVLTDAVPANTTYVADSTTLNGLPVGRPDEGTSPLVAGVYVSSSDLTPPLPTALEQATLSPESSAVVTFDLRVNAGTAAGTIIRNQAAVRTAEVPTVLTDGDGNPSTGPEPTVVVVGNGQQLAIAKEVIVVGGGPAAPGATLEYTVRVTNISLVPALYVVITDDLNMPVPGYLTLVPGSAYLNGASTGVTVNNQLITADYSMNYGPLQPQQSAVLRFRAVLNADLLDGTRVTNTGTVTWNNPPQTASASVTIDVGAIIGVGTLNGKVWHDANFNRQLEPNERVLEGWSVALYRNDRPLRTVETDMNGVYRISGIPPNYITLDRYELRFSAPDATATSAKLGFAYSPNFTNELQRIRDVIVEFASNLQDLNLPISPNGVAYDSVSRAPTAGVTLRMLSAGTRSLLPPECFDDPAQQNQVTLADGYYRFDLNFTDPACPSGGNYLIDVSPPPTGYIGTYSQIIPPTSGATTAAFDVPACPAGVEDALAGTADYCEVQTFEFAPTLAQRARSAGTRYHAHLKLDNNLIPGSSQIYNNHIPVDPDLQGVLTMSKTTPLLNVVRGQIVPYVITYKNVTEVPLFDVSIVDRIPPGFRYVEGSARIDRVPVEPAVAGRELIWSDLAVDRQESHELLVLLAVGAGVSEGEFVNRVQALHMLTGSPLSNEASATVRVVPDPTFDCTDVTGKVFDDINRNGLQDDGETGLPGVRVVSARGLTATTDAHGRYHITCAIVPREGRGSNFVLKLDDRTLPSGFRSSTDQVKIERATRGKALKFNFGASLHRVIGLDLADAVFEPGTIEMRAQWRPRLDMLMKELQKGPAILRLSYLADIEDEQLVERRMNAIKSEIASRWQSLNASYQLTIEPEVFWRTGAPPQHAENRGAP